MRASTFLSREWLFDIGDVEGKPRCYMLNEEFTKYSLFYGQKFSPEIIEKLFIGFTSTDLHTGFIFKSDKYYIKVTSKMEHHTQRGIVYLDSNGDALDCATNIFNYPRTLDEFISDADRCGVILEWNEEIIKTYFTF